MYFQPKSVEGRGIKSVVVVVDFENEQTSIYAYELPLYCMDFDGKLRFRDFKRHQNYQNPCNI